MINCAKCKKEFNRDDSRKGYEINLDHVSKILRNNDFKARTLCDVCFELKDQEVKEERAYRRGVQQALHMILHYEWKEKNLEAILTGACKVAQEMRFTMKSYNYYMDDLIVKVIKRV